MSSDTLRQRNPPKKVYPRDDRRDVLIRDEPTVVDFERDVDTKSMALMVLGLIGLNFLLSFFITGTATWGSESKLTKPRFYKHLVFDRRFGLADEHVFSDAELALYDGSKEHPNSSYQILLALNGTVYDVSENPATYGPSGPYHIFAGRDSARAFITGCFKSPEHWKHDLRGLDPVFARETIAGWQKFFSEHHKYWRVGTVKHDVDFNSMPDTQEEWEHLKKEGKIEKKVQWIEIPEPCENARGQKPGFRGQFVSESQGN